MDRSIGDDAESCRIDQSGPGPQNPSNSTAVCSCFTNLFGHVPDAAFIIDFSGIVRDANLAAERLSGYTRDELLGTSFLSLGLLQAADLARAEERLAMHIGGEVVPAAEYRVVGKSGGQVLVETCDYPIERDGQAALLTVARDISRLKDTEAELRDRETRLSIVTEQIPAILWTTDADLRITQGSGAPLSAMGLVPEDYIGKSIRELYQREGEATLMTSAHVRALTGASTRSESEWRGRFFEAHVEPLRDEEGNIQGAVGVALDVTKRKQAERKLFELNAALEERVRERTTELQACVSELESFCYAITHELRGPVRTAIAFAQLLEEEAGEGLDGRSHDYLARIGATARRMSTTIDALLQLSRIGRAQLQVEQVDLSLLANQIASRLQASAPERAVEFVVEDNLSARCDPSLASVLLENLLGNAWKFTGRTDGALIQVGRSDEPPDGPAYYVRDNGAGFEASLANTPFLPFKRLHRSDEFEGTGIGLATVKRIVDLHQGRVWAEGEKDEGAAFYFTLPQ